MVTLSNLMTPYDAIYMGVNTVASSQVFEVCEEFNDNVGHFMAKGVM